MILLRPIIHFGSHWFENDQNLLKINDEKLDFEFVLPRLFFYVLSRIE